MPSSKKALITRTYATSCSVKLSSKSSTISAGTALACGPDSPRCRCDVAHVWAPPPPPRFGTRIAWPPPGPTSESLLRGWYLLNLCVGSLPPSDHLFPYLRQFLLRTVALEGSHPFYEIAVEAQAKLERTRLNGPRQYPPIALEIDCVEVHVFAHDRTRGRPGSN